MDFDRLFLATLLLCSVVGLLHIVYYLGRIFRWAFCKVFIRREPRQFHKTAVEIFHDIGYDEFGR